MSEMERAEPRSPYVALRDTLDGGYSKGWGAHFQPSEESVTDCHVHLSGVADRETLAALVDEYFRWMSPFRLTNIVLFVEDEAMFGQMSALCREDARVTWLCYCRPQSADAALVSRALQAGALGVKVLNCPDVMAGRVDKSVWQTARWREIYSLLSEQQRPILWHVAQRVGYSPYHGGGYNSYYRDRAPDGIVVSNEELLCQFLDIAREYPNMPMIGAHQFHVGLERLGAIFDAHPNVYADTSCGMTVRWCDSMYPADRAAYRSFFLRYPERLLLGTDNFITPRLSEALPSMVEALKNHLRFLHQIALPDETLQDVCWRNAQRVIGVRPAPWPHLFGTRP